MMNNAELLQELETEFKKIKRELNFNCTLDQLDDVFFIRDCILASGFVSPKLSRMICVRIRDTFSSWIQQIHSWLIPSPYSLIGNAESQIFNEKEKEHLNALMKKFMAFVSENSVIGLSNDRQREAKFIDNSLKIWKENLPKFIEYSTKIHQYWYMETKENKKS